MTRHAKATPVGLLGLLSIIGLLLVPASASAAQIHVLSTSLGAPGSGDGQLALGEHSGVAVNLTSGDVYVADTANHRVVEFDPSKPASERFVRAFGANVGGAGVDVCTSGCVAGTAGAAPGQLESPTFVAVDNSAGSSKGDVYVADSASHTVTKFGPAGNLLAGWGSGGQIAGFGLSEPFSTIGGIVVDAARNLNVLTVDDEAMHRFNEGGVFGETINPPRGTFPGGLSIDTEGNFYKLDGSPEVTKFTPSGEGLGEPDTRFDGLALANGPGDGDLYVIQSEGGGFVNHYGLNCGQGCTPLESFGSGVLANPQGIAIGPDGAAYVTEAGASKVDVFAAILVPIVNTEAASAVNNHSAVLLGTVSADGGPAASCKFEYTTEASFEEEGFQGATSLPCSPTGPFTGSSSTAVSATVSGLDSSTTYRFRLVGTNENGPNTGQALSLQTLGPLVTGSAPSAITVTTALIVAQINPEGEETTFQVQYVSEAEFEESGFTNAGAIPVPPAAAGSGSTFAEASQRITGLLPGAAYRFRVVATNPSGSFAGPEGGFSTFPTPGGLPEGRAYEMASPAQKIGDVFPPEPTEDLGGSHGCAEFCQPGLTNRMMPIQSDPSGEALSFVGQAFAEGQAPASNQYISRRSPTGWTTQDATPLRADQNGGFTALSPDLRRGVLLQHSPALSPEAPIGEDGMPFPNFYLWEDGNPDLRPLVTVEPSSGSNFSLSFGAGNSGAAGSPAFTHLVFEADDALTPAVPGIAPEAPEAEVGECGDNEIGANSKNCDLYEWVGGQLRLINVLPGNTTAAQHAVLGSGRRLAVPIKSYQVPDVDNVISADGSRIFWSDESGQVYVRINGEETVKLNDPGQFITASPDGSRVMLSDGCLYSLTSKSCEASFGSDPNAFVGMLGADEDLSRIYFVDKEALAPGAQAEACQAENGGGTADQEENGGEVPPGRGCNLYVYDNGDVSHVATLVPADNTLGTGSKYGDWKPSPSDRTAQVSTDGRYLTFMSGVRLTDYDNRCKPPTPSAAFGIACNEVYQYDLDTRRLSCVSCNPSGLPPLGGSSLSLTRSENGGIFPQLRNLPSDGEGQVFFQSTDVLSSADHNGRVQDIYEWQPEGVGGCERAKGCVSLLSSGESSIDSFFLTSSSSGRDAFFITRAQLLLRDKDDLFDVYDVRAGGGINENVPPPCLGEACKGPATSGPETQSAGTAQFSGPGNEKPHKKKAHKHKKKSKKHKHKSKKKAHKRAAKSNRGGQK